MNNKKFIQIGDTMGRLSKFILEPYIQHTAKDELYVTIYSEMHRDVISSGMVGQKVLKWIYF